MHKIFDGHKFFFTFERETSPNNIHEIFALSKFLFILKLTNKTQGFDLKSSRSQAPHSKLKWLIILIIQCCKMIGLNSFDRRQNMKLLCGRRCGDAKRVRKRFFQDWTGRVLHHYEFEISFTLLSTTWWGLNLI